MDVQCLCGADPDRPKGIERYSIEFARALARNAGDHDVWLATSARASATTEHLFGQLIPRDRMLRFAVSRTPIEDSPANTMRAGVGEWIREAFIADRAPDIVHLASLWWDRTVTSIGDFESGLKTAVTHYDLIPLQHPEIYLPSASAQAWYRRKIQWLRNADLLLAISGHSKQEAIDALGIPGDRIVVIPGGADSTFRPVPPDARSKDLLRTKYNISGSFLLAVNIIDPRKNIDGLIRAFALLPSEMRATRQLVLVGGIDEIRLAGYRSTARAAGLSDHQVIITGVVPGADLRLLYGLCELFVMPSRHEGFGLPLLEAMACGAPVIASRATSLPEIVGRLDALFDPANPAAIAAKIHEVLAQPEFARSLREWSKTQVGRFNWDQSARLAWDAFAALQRAPESRTLPVAIGPKSALRLALVISTADHSGPAAPGYTALLRALSRYYELEIVLPQRSPEPGWPFACHDMEWLKANAGYCDRIVYDVSGRHYTSGLRALMEQCPGAVILRDITLGDALHRSCGADVRQWRQALYDEHGLGGVREFDVTGNASAFHCLTRTAENALGIIVGSADMMANLETSVGGWAAAQIVLQEGLGAISWEFGGLDSGVEALAEDLHAHIEKLFRFHPNARLGRLIDRIKSHSIHMSDNDLACAATCIAVNRLYAEPRILLDASLLLIDAASGIPRLARNIVDRLTRKPCSRLRIEPVMWSGEKLRTCPSMWPSLGVADFGLTDVPVEPFGRDRFVAPFLGADVWTELFAKLKLRQVRTYFIVCDILPIRHPDFFAEGVTAPFESALRQTASHADGIICISRAVAEDFHDWLIEQRIARQSALQIGWFHLGADFQPQHAAELADEQRDALNRALARPLALMVGSLEYRSDRKGYGQALDAMELLWGRGCDVSLGFVGSRVSPSDELTDRITHHPEFGARLFWFERPDDNVLTQLYKSAIVLLYPSHGEGFGLPLVEAAAHDLPILARDLPVFREIAGKHICYFEGYGGSDLAAALDTLLTSKSQGTLPSSAAMKPLSWADSADQLLSVILNENWYLTYEPAK